MFTRDLPSCSEEFVFVINKGEHVDPKSGYIATHRFQGLVSSCKWLKESKVLSDSPDLCCIGGQVVTHQPRGCLSIRSNWLLTQDMLACVQCHSNDTRLYGNRQSNYHCGYIVPCQ